VNKNYKVEAIILSRKNFGESDKILSIFSRQYGKKIILAKGIRKINSRRAAHLELFTQISAVIYKGKTMDLITEVVALNIFPNIRKSLERITIACIAMELINSMTAENQEAKNIYYLLFNFLNRLNLVNLKRSEALTELKQYKYTLLIQLGFLSPHMKLNSQELNRKIEEIIERKLSSENLLNKLYN
jgi:DNA repair protein RecO